MQTQQSPTFCRIRPLDLQCSQISKNRAVCLGFHPYAECSCILNLYSWWSVEGRGFPCPKMNHNLQGGVTWGFLLPDFLWPIFVCLTILAQDSHTTDFLDFPWVQIETFPWPLPQYFMFWRLLRLSKHHFMSNRHNFLNFCDRRHCI